MNLFNKISKVSVPPSWKVFGLNSPRETPVYLRYPNRVWPSMAGYGYRISCNSLEIISLHLVQTTLHVLKLISVESTHMVKSYVQLVSSATVFWMSRNAPTIFGGNIA